MCECLRVTACECVRSFMCMCICACVCLCIRVWASLLFAIRCVLLHVCVHALHVHVCARERALVCVCDSAQNYSRSIVNFRTL